VTDAVPALLVLSAGVAVTVIGWVIIRSSGANTGAGRRLAGARAHGLGELHDLARTDALPTGPIRVAGRVRCADPIHTPDGERLALLHRDVEVRLPDGQWRLLERLRDARSVDLWERSSSVPVDLAMVAEPVITIPQVWTGTAAELDVTHRAAVDRLTEEHGAPTEARSTTRQVMLVDELTVLAVAGRTSEGTLRLDPPPGGFLVTTVDLDVAMRLLAGPQRARMLAGYAVGLVGGIGIAAGLVGLVLALLG
jgi:hypothetical protein